VPEIATLRGETATGIGVIGLSRDNRGVYGVSTNADAIYGKRGAGAGEAGNPGQFAGVRGDSDTAAGVIGTSVDAFAVRGRSVKSHGVVGESLGPNGTATGGVGGHGVVGITLADTIVGGGAAHGVSGVTHSTSPNAAGVQGLNQHEGVGVLAQSQRQFALQAETFEGTGVFGRTDSGEAGVHGVGPNRGVIGETGGAGDAVFGWNGNSQASTGTGVLGQHEGGGPGVKGWSGSGPAIVAGRLTNNNPGRLLLTPAVNASGPPTTGPFDQGEITSDGVWLWLYKKTGASTSAWTRIPAAAPGFDNATTGPNAGKRAGVQHVLASPFRLLDTRPGFPAPNPPNAQRVKLNAGTFLDVPVTTNSPVPAGALAVIGTLSITGTDAPSGGVGYIGVYATGSPPPGPPTAAITWFGATQTLSTLIMSPLAPGTGLMRIHNGAAGGSGATHVIFDAVGFVF